MTGDLRKSWLRHWHTVIDDAVGKDPFFDFEAAYKDPYGDFRMHFMTWNLPDEGLRRCFGVLPKGTEMCNRAIEMRLLYRGEKSSMSQKDALALFQRGLDGLAPFVESEDLEELKKPICVRRVTRAEIQMPRGARVGNVLEGIDWKGRMSAENLETGSFLRETLYRLAHSYDVVDYVEWPLFPDPHSIDPFRGFALLALSDEYFPMLADGPVLFIVTDGAVKQQRITNG